MVVQETKISQPSCSRNLSCFIKTSNQNFCFEKSELLYQDQRPEFLFCFVLFFFFFDAAIEGPKKRQSRNKAGRNNNFNLATIRATRKQENYGKLSKHQGHFFFTDTSDPMDNTQKTTKTQQTQQNKQALLGCKRGRSNRNSI